MFYFEFIIVFSLKMFLKFDLFKQTILLTQYLNEVFFLARHSLFLQSTLMSILFYHLNLCLKPVID